MNGIWIGLLVVILVPVMLIAWSGKRKQLGTIKCNRCHYIGPASGTWRPFKGIVPTCGKCGGEDWQVIAGSHHTNIYDDTEVRLAALKVLLNKGQITREEYDLKMVNILTHDQNWKKEGKSKL